MAASDINCFFHSFPEINLNGNKSVLGQGDRAECVSGWTMTLRNRSALSYVKYKSDHNHYIFLGRNMPSVMN